MTRCNGVPERRRRGDRGSVTVELAILAPLAGLLLVGVVAVGRVQIARADVESAARYAAREISIARDPAAAVQGARDTLGSTLDVGSPSCRTVDFSPSIGDVAITLTVSCIVDLQAASMLPLPGSMTVSATVTEVIDTHRESSGP